MKNIYVNSKQELTEKLTTGLRQGFQCFRIRHSCNCPFVCKHPDKYLKANQRNAVIIIKDDTVKAIYVRCKRCTELQKKV